MLAAKLTWLPRWAAAQERAREMALIWAEGPAAALGQTRRLLRAGWELDRALTGTEEATTISEMVTSDEAQRLIDRFLAR